MERFIDNKSIADNSQNRLPIRRVQENRVASLSIKKGDNNVFVNFFRLSERIQYVVHIRRFKERLIGQIDHDPVCLTRHRLCSGPNRSAKTFAVTGVLNQLNLLSPELFSYFLRLVPQDHDDLVDFGCQ